MKLLKTICIILAVCGITFYVNDRMNQNVMLTEYTFSSSDIPKAFDGYKIMHISDLHNAPFSNMIIEHINEKKPDVIVFTGDVVLLPDYELDEALKIAEEFSYKIPMYAVSGNHETQNAEYEHIMGELWDAGIRCLENDGTNIKKGEEAIRLIGIRDPEHNVVEEWQIKDICGFLENETSEAQFSVLLSHRADLYPQISEAGADLILSGHLHGGIIRLPFVGGIMSKIDDKLPRYEYGVIKEGNGATMIVSGGCDKNPKKYRIFNPPEVVLITLDS